ncbi:hypothetical protein ACC745_39600, partial [Rhizobium ruizarguesonis]
QKIKAEAEAAILETRPAKARAVVAQLTALLSANPETSKGRATLKATEGEVIDPPHQSAGLAVDRSEQFPFGQRDQ